MANEVILEMDSTQKILLKRCLEKDGKAQKFFTSEVARLCDPYVPYASGNLKSNKKVGASYIHYKSDYAAKQYYTNKGGHNGALRGKQWDVRMWADRGNEIVKSVAKFVGGRT